MGKSHPSLKSSETKKSPFKFSEISEQDVTTQLHLLDSAKSNGCDEISNQILKVTALTVVEPP